MKTRYTFVTRLETQGGQFFEILLRKLKITDVFWY